MPGPGGAWHCLRGPHQPPAAPAELGPLDPSTWGFLKPQIKISRSCPEGPSLKPGHVATSCPLSEQCPLPGVLPSDLLQVTGQTSDISERLSLSPYVISPLSPSHSCPCSTCPQSSDYSQAPELFPATCLHAASGPPGPAPWGQGLRPTLFIVIFSSLEKYLACISAKGTKKLSYSWGFPCTSGARASLCPGTCVYRCVCFVQWTLKM